MARVKIKVERGNGLQQVVVVDTEATKGATIGTNVFNADGTLYVPASGGSGANIRNGYGILISGTSPKTISVNRAANFDWQGQHNWEKPLWAPDGTAAAPAYTFGAQQDLGAYRVGADNYGIATDGVLRWDVNTTRTYQSVPMHAELVLAASAHTYFQKFLSPNSSAPSSPALFEVSAFESASPFHGDDKGWQIGLWEGTTNGVAAPTAASSGYRWRYFGEHGSEVPDIDRNALVFYGHTNSATGVEVYRHNTTFYPGQMLFAPGTAAAPTIAWRDFPGSGMYGDSQNIKFTVGGTLKYNVGATGVFYSVPLFASDGSAASPSITFNSDGDNGFFFIGADQFGLTVGGTQRLSFSTAAVTSSTPFLALLGSLSNVSYGFNGDPNTGMYSPGADAVALVTNAIARLTIQSSQITTTFPIVGPAGSASAPTFSASGDPNTGMYLPGSDVLAFATAGTLRFQYGAAGQFGIGGATYGTANTQAIVSGGASAAPSWQTVLVDGQTQTLSGAKTWSGQHNFSAGGSAVNFRSVTDTFVYTTWVRNGVAVGDVGSGDGILSGGAAGDFGFASRGGNLIFAYASGSKQALSLSPTAYTYGNATDNPDHTFYGAMHYVSGLQNFADDTAAAAGGIAVNQLYRNGSVVMIRVS